MSEGGARFRLLDTDSTVLRDFKKGINYRLESEELAAQLATDLTEICATGNRYAIVINRLLEDKKALEEGLKNYKVTNERILEENKSLRDELNREEEEYETITSKLFTEANLVKSTEDFTNFLDREEEHKNG